jgi:hypothetical protein
MFLAKRKRRLTAFEFVQPVNAGLKSGKSKGYKMAVEIHVGIRRVLSHTYNDGTVTIA